jgi:hypothetical protein
MLLLFSFEKIYSTLCLIHAAPQAKIKAKEPAAQPATAVIGIVSPWVRAKITVYIVNKTASNPLINSIQADMLIMILKLLGIFFSFSTYFENFDILTLLS